jgi:hypothetical protein
MLILFQQSGMHLSNYLKVSGKERGYDPVQVLLIICELRKCDFILMQSTNLDHFQLIALPLMLIACGPIMRGGE